MRYPTPCFSLLILVTIGWSLFEESLQLDGFVNLYSFTNQTVLEPNRNNGIRLLLNVQDKSMILQMVRDERKFLEFLVEGFVEQFKDSSHVHGSFINNQFQGEIRLDEQDETYFVESAKLFNFSSDLYSTSLVYKWSDVSHSKLADHLEASLPYFQKVNSVNRFARSAKRHYSYDVSSVKAAKTPNGDINGKVCGLYLQVDYILYQEFLRNADYNEDVAEKELIALLHYHVRTVHQIFSSTTFSSSDGKKGPFHGLQISISRIKIYKTAKDFAKQFGTSEQQFNQSMDASAYLNLVSSADYDRYCASHIFTYRYFDGVLGLAWVFSSTSFDVHSGICAKSSSIVSNRIVKRIVKRSLNSGMLTLVNYGRRVSRAVSAVTFAHELGHNFGANHDNENIKVDSCAPGGLSGNYIMYSSATSGTKLNNRAFSNCSRSAIAETLYTLAKMPSVVKNCLKDVQQFCGNGVIDPGEECDCGFKEECEQDSHCCTPGDDSNAKMRCKLRSGAECSASQGPCCNSSSCSFIPAQEKQFCHRQEQCRQESYCNGSSYACPLGTPLADGKLCDDKVKTCFDGECKRSICELIEKESYTSCQATRPEGSRRYDRSKLCHVACRSSKSGFCYNSADIEQSNFSSSFELLLGTINDGEPIRLKPGSPCDEDRGYCDVLQRCRPVSAEGPLARLATILFSKKTVENFWTWIQQNLWVSLFIFIAFVVLSIGFVKLCAVHTKSDNRYLPPALNFGDTLRRARYISLSVAGRRHGTQKNSVRPDPIHESIPMSSEQLPSRRSAPVLQIRNYRRSENISKRPARKSRIVHSEYHIPPPQFERDQRDEITSLLM